jgi:phospholipid/cholesterol/gamma-HCH transport system permease protein
MATITKPSATAAPPKPAKPAKAPRKPGAFASGMKEAGEITEFTGQVFVGLRRVPRYTSEVLRQAAILVRGSSVIIFVMSMFIGMTAVTFSYFLLKAAGAADYLGLFSGLLMPRMADAIMFGYVFSAKVGCGMVAEIGAMRINDEIDAYEVEGVNPLSYVVGTRLAGALLYVPVAVTMGLLGGDAGSYLQGVTVFHATSAGGFLYYHWAAQNLTDNLQAYLNMGSMALFVVIVSCFYGYTAKGGPAGVGTACARSLLVNIVMVHVIATFWIFIFFGLNPSLPIGG